MTILYLILLVTRSYALQYTLPENFGGNTDFSERGWRMLIGQLSPEVKLGKAPTRQVSIVEEPTCYKYFAMCSTTYFGKLLSMEKAKSAELWVKWHQDFAPFACNSPGGCSITAARSVADLTGQSVGWGVTASLDANTGTNYYSPTINGNSKTQLNFQYSESPITSKTMVSTRTLTSKCSRNHICFIHTGPLMIKISGSCKLEPLLVCDRHYYPCEDFLNPRIPLCSQWGAFTSKHCHSGAPTHEDCSMNVAVTSDNGEPIGFQIFEQKPMPGKKHIAKLDFSSAESPLGELPDGSSGAWMAWKF